MFLDHEESHVSCLITNTLIFERIWWIREGRGRHFLERGRRKSWTLNLERESTMDNEMFVTKPTYILLTYIYHIALSFKRAWLDRLTEPACKLLTLHYKYFPSYLNSLNTRHLPHPIDKIHIADEWDITLDHTTIQYFTNSSQNMDINVSLFYLFDWA